MKSIQEIFAGRFAKSHFAVIQKCEKMENPDSIIKGYTKSWPQLNEETELVVLVFMDSSPRELWVGKLKDQLPEGDRFGFLVDKFDLVGFHDTSIVNDADFYGTGGGGGARINIVRSTSPKAQSVSPLIVDVEPGEMVQRLVWLRKNHANFKDPVWNYWGGKCALTRADCDKLLVASHIKPWSESSPYEKTDCHNGLLLAASIDALFDRGLISFSDAGDILLGKNLSAQTAVIFGVRKGMKINAAQISESMKKYLAWHRTKFCFE